MSEFIPVSQPSFPGNEREYLLECIESGWISSAGKYITQFEELNAQYYGMAHGVATSNGTTALHIALLALGIGPGDEVLVPAFTFAASANTVLYTGATAVLVDVEPDSWTIAIDRCRELLTPRTKAIMPVHIFGQPCAMNEVVAFAEEHGLAIIEDCAEAHGARFAGKRVGSFGAIGCFSFYGNKIITCGEGGICVTDDTLLAEKMRVLRDHGMSKQRRYWHEVVGFNYRMTNLQAAIGCAQMERIAEILQRRRAIAERYDRNFHGIEHIEVQHSLPQRERVCWQYGIQIDTMALGRTIEEIRAALAQRNVDSRPFFHAIHEMPPYHDLRRDDLRNCERIAANGLCLPTFDALTDTQVDTVSNCLIEVLNG